MPSSKDTALLVLHMQPPVLELMEDKSLPDTVALVIADAREAELPVIYVNIGFRDGYPELPEGDRLREMLSPHNALITGVSNAIHEKVAPREGDLQVTSPRHSAFSGTDLEVLARVHRINHLVLVGASTGGVVFGTATEADDKKFNVTVLNDACTDSDPDVHRVLLELLPKPPRRVRVISASEWTAELAS